MPGKNKLFTHEHFHHPFDSPDSPSHRRVARVALQQRLGILSQRRAGFGRSHSGDPFDPRKIVKLGTDQPAARMNVALKNTVSACGN
jgi:hypothetical protein